MKMRCYSSSHEAYARYSGKGVTVCADWLCYGNFMRWALDNGYSDDLEIDRFPDNGGHYEPGNCRWATRSQNGRNKDNNIAPVSAFGESKIPLAWVEDPRCVVSYHLILKRISAGWPAELAISTPSQYRAPRKVGFMTGGLRPKGSTIPKAWREP